MDYVLRAADCIDDGGGFGGAEVGQGGFGEHIRYAVQGVVVDGLADGGGGDDAAVGELLPGEDPALDALGGQGLGQHLIVDARHHGAGLAAQVANRDAQGLGDADKEGGIQAGLGPQDPVLGLQKVAGEGGGEIRYSSVSWINTLGRSATPSRTSLCRTAAGMGPAFSLSRKRWTASFSRAAVSMR